MLTEETMLDKAAVGVQFIDYWVGIPICCDCKNSDLVLGFKRLQTFLDERSNEKTASLSLLGCRICDVYPVQ
jgi:hypothetical protein